MAVRREANCARNRGLLAFLPAEARHRARSEWASGGRQGLSVLRFFGVAAVSDAQNKALAGETPLRGETPAVRAGRMPATQRTEWPSGGRQGLTVLRFFRVAAVSDAQNKALAGETPQRGETPAGRAGRPGGPLSGMPATQRTERPCLLGHPHFSLPANPSRLRRLCCRPCPFAWLAANRKPGVGQDKPQRGGHREAAQERGLPAAALPVCTHLANVMELSFCRTKP